MLEKNLIIWSKLQMKYLQMDIWKANEFNFLNEEVEQFANR